MMLFLFLEKSVPWLGCLDDDQTVCKCTCVRSRSPRERRTRVFFSRTTSPDLEGVSDQTDTRRDSFSSKIDKLKIRVTDITRETR